MVTLLEPLGVRRGGNFAMHQKSSRRFSRRDWVYDGPFAPTHFASRAKPYHPLVFLKSTTTTIILPSMCERSGPAQPLTSRVFGFRPAIQYASSIFALFLAGFFFLISLVSGPCQNKSAPGETPHWGFRALLGMYQEPLPVNAY